MKPVNLEKQFFKKVIKSSIIPLKTKQNGDYAIPQITVSQSIKKKF